MVNYDYGDDHNGNHEYYTNTIDSIIWRATVHTSWKKSIIQAYLFIDKPCSSLSQSEYDESDVDLC